MNVSLWKLADDYDVYSQHAGWFILVSPDGEDEVMSTPMQHEDEAIAYAKAQGWTIVPLMDSIHPGTVIQSDPVPVTGPLPEWAKDGSSLPRDRWFAQARRAARILYAYEELVDDWEDKFEHAFADGADPIEIVRQIGENLGLISTNILIPR